MKISRKLLRTGILVSIGLFLKSAAFSQLPSDYKHVKGESPVGRDDYYTNGRIKIFHDVVQEFGDAGAAEWIRDTYKGFTIIKTKDGLVVGIGNVNGTNMYIVFKGQTYYIATSKVASEEYSNMSKYVLQKVRQLGNTFLAQ